MKSMLSLIVAHSRNRVIGKDGRLPWRIPGELKRFRELTMGHAVIMGRKSYEEIGKPLPGRFNIVVSASRTFEGEDLVTARNLEEALALAGDKKIFIAGGGQIFAQMIDKVDVMYITEIDARIEGDAYFPEMDYFKFDRVLEKHVDGDLPYDYVTYTRK